MGEMIRVLERIVQKPAQVNMPNLLNSWEETASFIGKLFKKASLVNKNVPLHKLWGIDRLNKLN